MAKLNAVLSIDVNFREYLTVPQQVWLGAWCSAFNAVGVTSTDRASACADKALAACRALIALWGGFYLGVEVGSPGVWWAIPMALTCTALLISGLVGYFED